MYTIDEQGRNRQRLTDIGRIGRARFSHDGLRIVFEREESENPVYNSDLYMMNADGSNLRNITRTGDWVEFEPDWSPDGTRIVFRGRPTWEEYSKVYIMNADGSGRIQLTDINNSNRDPTWSPSGEELIYGRLTRDPSTGEHWQIWRMNAWGGDQRCIIGCGGNLANFSNVPVAWKGNRIAFRGWEGGDWDVFLANADGTGARQLTHGGFDEKTRDWLHSSTP